MQANICSCISVTYNKTVRTYVLLITFVLLSNKCSNVQASRICEHMFRTNVRKQARPRTNICSEHTFEKHTEVNGD